MWKPGVRMPCGIFNSDFSPQSPCLNLMNTQPQLTPKSAFSVALWLAVFCGYCNHPRDTNNLEKNHSDRLFCKYSFWRMERANHQPCPQGLLEIPSTRQAGSKIDGERVTGRYLQRFPQSHTCITVMHTHPVPKLNIV